MEMTVKLEWRDGVPIFTLPDGAETVFSRHVIGGDTPVDAFRRQCVVVNIDIG